MINRYRTKKRISFNVTKPIGKARAEKINIDPSRIIEINTSTNSFIVRSSFNEDVIYKVSLQGETISFKPNFYESISNMEKEGLIKKE